MIEIVYNFWDGSKEQKYWTKKTLQIDVLFKARDDAQPQLWSEDTDPDAA